LKNGTKLEQTVEAPRGSEQRFSSEADIVQKFKKLAVPIIGEPKADNIAGLVLSAEKLDRAEQIAQVLADV